MFADSDSWRSNWPFPPVKFKKFDQSKIEKTTKTIVLCYFSGFDQKIFGLWFWIFHASWVNWTSWNQIRQYFCRRRIFSIFFKFLKMSKNHKDHYRVTNQAKYDFIAFRKKFKNRKNIEKKIGLQKYFQIRFLCARFTHPTWKIKNRWDARFGLFGPALLKK